MAPALPATIDALGITATGIWITGTASAPRVRRFARTCALLAIVMSIGGNATWHLHAAGLLDLTFEVVLGVGTVPPIVLGLCSHLAALRRLGHDDGEAENGTNARPRVSAQDGTPVVPKAGAHPARRRAARAKTRRLPEDELFAAAQQADVKYRQQHGRSITRDALRSTLKVGTTTATELLRQLRSEAADPAQQADTGQPAQ